MNEAYDNIKGDEENERKWKKEREREKKGVEKKWIVIYTNELATDCCC